MTVLEVAEILGMQVLAGKGGLQKEVKGGCTGDLLSFVMAHAQEKNLWVTIQGHINSVAVASLMNLSGIILAADIAPDEAMLVKADEEQIPILTTNLESFEVVRLLVNKGIA
ncbi:MAG: DRTGG domain-containing protein [Cellulosilyticaceae bacterium]